MSRKRSNSPCPPEPQAQEGVGPDPEPEPQPARFRVNWHFTGFRPCELQEGDVIEATEAEAAPYVGRVLTRIE